MAYVYTGSGGYYEVWNQQITQTLDLSASIVSGTTIRVRFDGNGVDNYLVQSATLSQGSVSVSVTCNSQTTFYVPALGRWSDYVSYSGMSPSSPITLTAVVRLKVPILIPIVGDGDDTQTGAASGGVVVNNYEDVNILRLNFDVADGATSWPEETHGWFPNTNAGVQADTAQKYSGTASLLLWNGAVPPTPQLKYVIQTPSENFTLTQYVRFSSASMTGGYIDFVSLGKYDGTGGGVQPFVVLRMQYTGGQTYLVPIVQDYSGLYADILNDDDKILNPLSANTWYEVSIEVRGRAISISIGGTEYFTGVAELDNPFQGINSWRLYNTDSATYCWIDDVTWTSNSMLDIVAIQSTATITVSNNTLVDAGDTITITRSTGEATVYTFVDVPTGASNEIVIGPSVATTAANIATAIDATYGALFDATSSAAVATVTITDTATYTITTDCTGLTVGSVAQTITYSSTTAESTLPAFTALGEAGSIDTIGDVFATLTMAPLSSTGSASKSGGGIVGSPSLPALTASGNSFMSGKNTSSSEQELLDLLLCSNSYMQDFADMVVVPGANHDVTALLCAQWVAANIDYVTDTVAWGADDYWISPRATMYYGQGDCEDMAYLLASLMQNAGITASRVRVYLGETYGVGHAWVGYQRISDNQWVVMDCTLGNAYWAALSSIDSLTPNYPTIYNINLLELNPDLYAYGRAWAHVECSEYTSLDDSADDTVTLYLASLLPDENSAVMEASIPAITLAAFGDGYLNKSIPAVTISASGTGFAVGSLNKSIPAIVLTATATSSAYGTLDTSIPAVKLTASGSSHALGTLEKSIPAIQLTASGISGRIGNLEKSIGAITLAASSYVQNVGVLEASIPAVTLVARANNTIIALVMNTRNFALTKYTNFGFNSFANFNGELLAAKAGGIYKMTGNTDDGEEIPWKLRVGAIDTIKNRITHVWLSGDISDDLTLTVETADGDQYDYLVQSVSADNDETRVKVGKGLRSRYVTLELVPKTDAVLKLAKMNVFADVLEKKR